MVFCSLNYSKAINLNSHTSRDLSGIEFVTLSPKFSNVTSDSTSSNRISRVWYTTAELNVEITQVEKQQEVSISVYNMLGKLVLEVFRGVTSTKEKESYSMTFNLPNGIYICILQGKNFKDSEKFIISR